MLDASAAGVRHQSLEVRYALPKRRIRLPQAFAFACLRIGKGKAPGPQRERPAIFAWEIGEALHGGPVNALADDLIQREYASLAGAGQIGEGDRRGAELGGIRAMPITGRAVAHGAGRLEQSLAPWEARRRGGGERDGIGLEKVCRQSVRQCRDFFGRSLAADNGLEARGPRHQCRALRRGRQGPEPRRHGCREFRHLGIFRSAFYPAFIDSAAIVHGHIVEQPPGGLHVVRVGGRCRAQPGRCRDEPKKCDNRGEDAPSRCR